MNREKKGRSGGEKDVVSGCVSLVALLLVVAMVTVVRCARDYCEGEESVLVC